MGSPGRRFMSDINVTPLVDVMLVLLIIFMVTAPMMMQGVDVSLPQTVSTPLPSDEDHLIISVDSAQQIYINDYKVGLEALQGKIGKILENRPDQRVYLRADRGIPYGVVVRVISEVRNAGVARLGMVTEPLEEAGKK